MYFFGFPVELHGHHEPLGIPGLRNRGSDLYFGAHAAGNTVGVLPAVRKVVHLIVNGGAACGFSPELPVNWPLGHTGVKPETAYYASTCEGCKKRIPPPEADEDLYCGWHA